MLRGLESGKGSNEPVLILIELSPEFPLVTRALQLLQQQSAQGFPNQSASHRRLKAFPEFGHMMFASFVAFLPSRSRELISSRPERNESGVQGQG